MKILVLGVSICLLILGLNGCSDDAEILDNSIKKYSNLPLKKDLSYFSSSQNIVGQVISRIDNSPLSGYEKGLEFGGNRDIRKERFQSFFKINKYKVDVVATARINSKDLNEFEIDGFETKLKEEFAKSIQPIRGSYKNIDKHIRITNLDIPVKYSKKFKNVANLKITDITSLKKLNYSKQIILSDFVKEVLNNEYISQYIIPSKGKYKFENIVTYDEREISDGLEIKGDVNILNDIGKVNKGKDSITELTLHIWDSRGSGDKSYITQFGITSFKLKSSNKRFVLDMYTNLIDASQYFGKEYLIKENDVDMFIKEDD